MKLRDIFDATLGRLFLPTPSDTPAAPSAAEQWVIGNHLFYRNADGDLTLRVLTDADFNVPDGVPQLGADGIIPVELLPGNLTSVTSVPIGGGIDYYGDPNDIPAGFLVCDGSEYLREEYPALYAKCKVRFGRPSTDEYFRVPDRIGRVAYGAWPYENSGMIRRVDVLTRGQGYTPGSYTFTFTGGTFSSAATGRVVIVSEFVPGVGTTGVIDRVEITLPGTYSSLGDPLVDGISNVEVRIPSAALPGGLGFTYEIFAQPIAVVRPVYAYSIQMDNHGTGYTTPPEVVIAGASLKGATGYAIIRGGGVAEVVITNPGYGSITAATVSFVGGGGASAAATIRTELRYVMQGDYHGEEQHLPLLGELVAHTHPNSTVSAVATGIGTGGGLSNGAATTSAGGSYPMQIRPAGVGVIPLIRAS